MPFELGLTVTWAKLHPSRHTWFVCEAQNWRANKSLRDPNGTDLNIHGGTVAGIMHELCNAFLRRTGPRPTVPQMMQTYRIISQRKAAIMASAGSNSLFEARVFRRSLLRYQSCC
jgi:hypothetical protein